MNCEIQQERMVTDVYIVTGASRGIGHALVSELTSRDNTTTLAIMRKPIVAPEWGPNIHQLYCDLGEGVRVSELLKTMCDLTATLQPETITFISNAAVIAPIVACGDITKTSLQTAFQVNCYSPIQIASRIVTFGQRRKYSTRIINVTTGAAVRPIAHWGAYCASKSAAAMMFDVLALENSDCSICSYDPGVVDTGMQQEIRLAAFPQQRKFQELKESGNLQSPQEAARKLLKSIC